MFKNHEIRELKVDSPEYPALLKKSKYAVPLWIAGENFRDEFCLATVGTRTPSGLAASSVKSLVKTLKNHNVRIVSGLAQGIDSLCHTAAIDNGLPTTAVIAQGLDVPMQSSQKILAEKILKLGGNIITPYAPGTRAYLSSFVKRNTVISGMSNATLVVESRLKGGAMHTANFCIRENKPLLAMPGSPMNPTSEGCNFLIHKKQAQIVWSARELPEVLGLNSLFPLSTYSTSRTAAKTELPNWATEGTILQINDICEQSEKSVNEVLTMLTELEIMGKCRVNGQNVIFL